MNLVKLIDTYGDEDSCREYLEDLRWPGGAVECPRCESARISRIKARGQFDCDECRYQFSVTSGTLFHDTHLPLRKWFLAVYLICESKKGISASQLKRTLGVAYKTAWYLSHRIRAAMGTDDSPLLDGVIEMDETWIGGRRKAAVGQWRQNKTMIIGAVERGGELRLQIKAHADGKTLKAFIEAHVNDQAEAIYTDEWNAYDTAVGDIPHGKVNHSIEQWVQGDVHTQTIESVWSLFKRSIIGSYHKLSVKHLPAYLDEMEFRYNNRDNPYLFRDTLLVLLSGEALPYKHLVGK